ncbi:hypothetical protein SEPCBS119000_005725 [Sporothrix epigloea]|uniref:HNH nuclease domain-containing protein n=1 Tax=Sporothrix epigloea TaxID=1892477 RepID=A0ABP0E1E0_9PEZI
MAATTVAQGLLDHNRLVELLASIGAGEEAVQQALRERATVAPVTADPHADLLRQILAYDVVYQLLLPFRAISEAAGGAPVDGDAGSDSDDESIGSSSTVSLHSDDVGSELQRADTEDTHCDISRVFIFPPSPLLALGQPESDDNLHTDSAIQAARCLDLIDPEAAALLRDTASDAQASTIFLSSEWIHAFSRFEAVIVPWDPGMPDGDMSVRPVDGNNSCGAQTISFKPSTLSRRLLALHAKVARILHETRASNLIDDLLSDNVNAVGLAGDGRTHAGLLMQLRLDGWYPAKKRRHGRWSRARGGLEDTDATTIWIEEARLVQEEECK